MCVNSVISFEGLCRHRNQVQFQHEIPTSMKHHLRCWLSLLFVFYRKAESFSTVCFLEIDQKNTNFLFRGNILILNSEKVLWFECFWSIFWVFGPCFVAFEAHFEVGLLVSAGFIKTKVADSKLNLKISSKTHVFGAFCPKTFQFGDFSLKPKRFNSFFFNDFL